MMEHSSCRNPVERPFHMYCNTTVTGGMRAGRIAQQQKRRRKQPRIGGQPTAGPFFSNAKTVSSGTTVHRDLTHVARSREHGAEARGRPSVRLMFLCVHSVTNFSRNKTNIITKKITHTRRAIDRSRPDRGNDRGTTSSPSDPDCDVFWARASKSGAHQSSRTFVHIRCLTSLPS